MISQERLIACASAAGSRASSLLAFASSQSKNSPIDDQAVLDDFGEAGAQLAIGQRVQRVGVREHRGRLMERADEVLAARDD